LNVAGEPENCSLGVVKRCYRLLRFRKFVCGSRRNRRAGRGATLDNVECDNLPGLEVFEAPCYGLYRLQEARLISRPKSFSDNLVTTQIAATFYVSFRKKEKLNGDGRGTVTFAGQPSTRVSASDRA
jgi:hypothetical protein